MKPAITLTAALLIWTPTVAQSQVVQITNGKTNSTNSIINANNFNGQGNKRVGTYDYSNAPDCTQVDANNWSLGSMIITKVAEGRQGGVEIIGFHKNFSCFLTWVSNLKIWDIIISIWSVPVKSPVDLSKMLNKSNPGGSISILSYDKDWQYTDVRLEIIIGR